MAFFRPYFFRQDAVTQIFFWHSLGLIFQTRCSCTNILLVIRWSHPKAENAGRLQNKSQYFGSIFSPQIFYFCASFITQKKREKKRRKRKGQLILFFAYSLTCKLWSELPLQQKDKADFPTQHHAGQEHMPNSSTHFFGNRFSVFGEVPVATPNPILSNTHTHTHTHTSQEV